jgi:hypothetical protein
MRGFDQGGLYAPPMIASGMYSGPTLSTNSIGQGIQGGAKAAAAGYDAYSKAKAAADKDKKNQPDIPDPSPGIGATSPMDSYKDYARGGRIKRTSGPRIGKDDGLIPAQRGEYVIRKSAVKKLGTKVLGQVNRGKLPQGKRGR